MHPGVKHASLLLYLPCFCTTHLSLPLYIFNDNDDEDVDDEPVNHTR